MTGWIEKLAKDLNDMSVDIRRLIDNRKKKMEAKEGDVPKEKRLRSLQKLTTFYSSEKEAKEMSKEDDAIVFIDKRLKEIFKG
jgi:hypothetical protein